MMHIIAKLPARQVHSSLLYSLTYTFMRSCILLLTSLMLAGSGPLLAGTGNFTILTTADGANLPAGAELRDFPVLVRLRGEWFPFAELKPDGSDLRFFDEQNQPLAFHIDEWSPAEQKAAVWVRIPKISGNSRQALKAAWGKESSSSPAPGSDAKAVFNATNGYAGVWHMAEPVVDATGGLEMKDTGTKPAAGVVGSARRFADGKGVFGGENISHFPSEAQPHTTEMWFRAEQPNASLVGWGNEKAQGKVVVQFRSPPHIRVDGYFSASNVDGASRLKQGEWTHVAHAYENGKANLYVNGVLDGSSKGGPPMAIKQPARLWLGGWYHRYDFTGEMDEVRISSVGRSAEWIRLSYENQKPLQSLVGPLQRTDAAKASDEFAIATAPQSITEGSMGEFRIKAAGAEKIAWSAVRNGVETVLAVDTFSCKYEPGRVSGEESLVVKVKAIFPQGAKTLEFPVTIQENIPDPEFALDGPTSWNGRSAITLEPKITNLPALEAKGAGKLETAWNLEPIAVIKEIQDRKLLLTRAQNSGTLTVTATISNGGKPISKSIQLKVSEPTSDAWIPQPSQKAELPNDGQFYGCDATGKGSLIAKGNLTTKAEEVFLRVTVDDKPWKAVSSKPGPNGEYFLSLPLEPKLVNYRAEIGQKSGDQENVIHSAHDLVCGHVYLLNGQSNTVATDWGKGEFNDSSPWIRSFGSMGGNSKEASWGPAVRRGKDGKGTIGYWGYDLAKHLVETHKVPVCILNGAVGGTRIDQHQRNPQDPTDPETIYGRLLARVRQAGLTHSVRAIFWHQGENDQGADGPTGGYGWEAYRQYFIDLAASWKTDYPNVQKYYLFQIWPKACAMGVDGSDNRLREVQRQLPTAFSQMSIMSTLGIDPPGGCHYPAEGYAQIAKLIAPLVERDFYNKKPTTSITPANLRQATFTNPQRTEIRLEFDQPIDWANGLESQFWLDGKNDAVATGRTEGNHLILSLKAATTAKSITYLDSKSWSPKFVLRGANGIAALTFWGVAIE